MFEVPTPVPELEFWNVKRTTDELEIVANSLKSIRPYLHVLKLPRNTSLYPNYYTRLYKQALPPGDTSSLKAPAVRLSTTDEALQTVYMEEDTLDYLLTEHTIDGHLLARDLEDILSITPSTITDWQDRGDIEAVRRGSRLLWIPAGSLNSAISWQRPEGMPPAPTPIYPPSSYV